MLKKNMFRLFIFFICFLFLFIPKQHLLANRFHFSCDLGLGIPLNTFKENMENKSFGPVFSLKFGVRIGQLPIFLGVTGELSLYGYDGRTTTIFIPEFGSIDIDIRNSYSMYGGYVFLRLTPFEMNRLKPYIEAMVGIRGIVSRTSIPGTYCGEGTSSDLARVKNLSDSSLSFQINAGLMFRIWGSRHLRHKRLKAEHSIQFGISYSSLGKVKYMTEGSVVVKGNDVTHLTYESKINHMKFSVGYVFQF